VIRRDTIRALDGAELTTAHGGGPARVAEDTGGAACTTGVAQLPAGLTIKG
jgi:hypothetical protein